jgi:hydrogenase nickel incorporation protein HypB
MAIEHVHMVKHILVGNDQIAEVNRDRFNAEGVFTINVMASPGSGKTSVISKTIEALHDQMSIGVIEGDIQGSIDANTVLAAGANDAVQINTGGNCHLEANMIQKALENIDLAQLDMLFVENVGNLICPTHWDLGQHLRVCILSTPEGHDKPIKYPQMFSVCEVILVNKIDLIEWVDFDLDLFYQTVGALNPTALVFEISCRTGKGLPIWIDWLCNRKQALFGA